jgi:glycosyltransferase involved in cell wall biosynthesis
MASAGNQQRRALIIVQNLPVPFDRRVWLEATSLSGAGYAVSVICPKFKGYERSYECLEDIDIYRYALPVKAEGPFGFVAEFAWCFIRTAMRSATVALRGRGFDVIQACNPPETYWLLGRWWRLFGKRFIFDHHDLSPEMYAAKFGRSAGMMYRGLRLLERLTFNAADVVITTNESHKEIAIRRGGVPPQRIFVVRSGPDLSRFSRYPLDERYREGKAHVLVYLGEICKQDGVDHLVRALKVLTRDHGRSDVHCIFVGGGPHQPVIKDYAAQLGLEGVTTFTGRVSDEELCRILSSADVGIDPDPKTEWSDKSTMNKVMEYMYFGLPIVAYDLRETRFSAQDAAVYADANSETALARAIAELLDDPAKRQEMGAFGERRLREALAWQYSVAPLLAAYEAATRGAPHTRAARASYETRTSRGR